MWSPPPAAVETALGIFFLSRIQQPYKSHVMVVHRLMILSWRNKMGEGADLLLTVPVGVPCWGLGEHEPLILYLFHPIVSRRKWKGPCTIREID